MNLSSRPTLMRAGGTAAILLGLATAGLAAAGGANATDPSSPTFDFPKVGTVVVTGKVTDSLNYTVYQIDNPKCTGTAFGDDCVPQTATGTINIPAGTYDHKKFTVADVPSCGPIQQDVYNGAYQAKVTSSGSHQFVAGGIKQLGACKASTSPSPTPTTSAPTSPSSTPTTTAPSTPTTSASSTPSDTATTMPPTSPAPTSSATTPTTVGTAPTPTLPVSVPDGTSTPFVPVAGTTMNQQPSGGIEAASATAATSTAAGAIYGGGNSDSGYRAGSTNAGQLASTGVPSEALGAIAGAAVALGGGLLLAGRRRTVRSH